MSTDASKKSWCCAIDEVRTGKLWTLKGKKLLAVYFGLKSHKSLVSHKHVKVIVDNTTVQITLNKMGTWRPMAMKMLTQARMILPRKTSTLFLPSNSLHPLHDTGADPEGIERIL